MSSDGAVAGDIDMLNVVLSLEPEVINDYLEVISWFSDHALATSDIVWDAQVSLPS